MGDARGPRHRGGDDHGPDDAPRHLAPATPRIPRYVRPFSPSGEDDQDVPAHGTPADVALEPVAPVHGPAPTPAPGPVDQPPAGTTGNVPPPIAPWPAPAAGRRHAAGAGTPFLGRDRYDDADDDQRGGIGSSLRAARAEAVWRYRSAPLWVRITACVAAASAVLVMIVGISLTLRQDDGSPEATVNRTPVTVATTVTTAATTTTTVPPTTTTTVPPTTTTTVPPTTTTAPPVVPPPTEAPTTTVPPTTTTEAVRYHDCSEAWFAGALPLFEDEPGYGPHLDRDGDGEACEWDERRRD